MAHSWLGLVLLAALLGGCNLPSEILATVTALPQPTSTSVPVWQAISQGLEWRTLRPDGDELAQLVVVRVDPAKYQFRAHYRAGAPLNLAGWRDQQPEAQVIINANFFDREHQVLGGVVSDGVRFGKAYRDRGGTFLLRDGAASVIGYMDGSIELSGRVEQAAQGFPLLVHKGEQTYVAAGTGARSRRTVIAEDARGRILIMVAPFLGQTLEALSAYLPTTDLEVETAVNLDGGGSTLLAITEAGYSLPSFDAVPTILAVYRRS